MCSKPRRDCADGKAVPEKSGIASFFLSPADTPVPDRRRDRPTPGRTGERPRPDGVSASADGVPTASRRRRVCRPHPSPGATGGRWGKSPRPLYKTPFISAATGDGVRELMEYVAKTLETLPPMTEYEAEISPEEEALAGVGCGIETTVQIGRASCRERV